MKTKNTIWLIAISISAFIALVSCQASIAHERTEAIAKEEYACIPCGHKCDTATYNEPGTCKSCNMPLVKKNTIHFEIIAPADVCAYVQAHPAVVLLDVRTQEEFEGKAEPNFGSLKNAINLSVQDLPTQMHQLDSFKNREIIVYCSHSHRSPMATYMLSQNGFANVKNMSGGMSEMAKNECVINK
jgi:rhodanese-related sulfurtransferase